MIGIYKITNKINNKIYIGQSIEIEERIKEHKRIPFRPTSPAYNYPLYQDIRLYGLDNFTFEILQECLQSELNELEIFYIQKYNSFNNGYNQTPGGDSQPLGNSSNHHILTQKEVEDIRRRYNNHEKRWDVFEDYKHKISRDTFAHIWTGQTWRWCMPEVFTEENIKWHKNNLGELKLTKNTKITTSDVKSIRARKKNKEKRSKVYDDYKDKISFSAFNAIWYNQSWKGVTNG